MRTGAATSTFHKNLGQMTVGLETERGKLRHLKKRHSNQAEERDHHTAPQPPLIQTGPTTVQKHEGNKYLVNTGLLNTIRVTQCMFFCVCVGGCFFKCLAALASMQRLTSTDL